MRSAVRKMGNSAGVIIPKSVLLEVGAKVGDDVDMVVDQGRIIMSPVTAGPRRGWAEDARRLAADGQDALIWPEFGDADDRALVW